MSPLYQDPSISHDEAIALLASDVEANIKTALISIGLNEQDNQWAQNTCLEYLNSSAESIAASAIIALGHIARRHGRLSMTKISPALENAKSRFPALEATVADTLEDIELFT